MASPIDALVYDIVFDVDDADLKDVERSTERLERNLRDISQTFAILGGAIVGFAGLAVREFTGLDSALARTRAQIGLTDEEMREFREGIRGLGSIAGSTETDLVNASFAIQSVGQRGQEAIDTLTVAEKARAAQYGEGAVITRFLTSAIAAFTDDALDAARAGDVLAAAITVGNLEARGLAPAMQSVNAQAASLGISIDEVAASMAAMSLVQPELTRNATGFRAILSALTRDSDQAATALARYGLTIDQVRETISQDFLSGIELLTTSIEAQACRNNRTDYRDKRGGSLTHRYIPSCAPSSPGPGDIRRPIAADMVYQHRDLLPAKRSREVTAWRI